MPFEKLVFSYWIAGIELPSPIFDSEKKALKGLLQKLISLEILTEKASARDLLDGMNFRWGIDEKFIEVD